MIWESPCSHGCLRFGCDAELLEALRILDGKSGEVLRVLKCGVWLFVTSTGIPCRFGICDCGQAVGPRSPGNSNRCENSY